MSVRKEMYREAQHIVISSDDEEDNFDRYLTTLKKGNSFHLVVNAFHASLLN